MNAKKFADRAAGFYLGLTGGLLFLIALIRYLSCNGVTENGINMLVVLPLAAAIALIVASVFVDSDVLTVLTPAIATVALATFIIDSINILTGYIFGLAMFGDVSMIGAVAQVSILTAAALLALVIGAFLKKNQND